MSEFEMAKVRTLPAQKPGRSKQDYCTPAVFLKAVLRRFGLKAFAIDLAATAENTVAALFYSEAENALTQPWRTKDGGLGFLNPPFADIAPWVEKAHREARIGARLVMLVPAAVGSNWWKAHVHQKAFVLLLNGRLTFVGQPTCYPKDCCLLLYGPDVAPGYDVWQWPQKPPLPRTKGWPAAEPGRERAAIMHIAEQADDPDAVNTFRVGMSKHELMALGRGEVPEALQTGATDLLVQASEPTP